MHRPIPQLIAHVLYKYDAETGEIYSRRRKRAVGTTTSRGYRLVTISCGTYAETLRANRIAWAMQTGWDPADLEIDHKNGVRDDNRISNLQPLTTEQNKRKANGSATPGIYRKHTGWVAEVARNGIVHRGNVHQCPLMARMQWYELVANAG